MRARLGIEQRIHPSPSPSKEKIRVPFFVPFSLIRLLTFFKTSTEFWMNLQMTHDLRNAEKALPARGRKSIEENRSALA